MKKLLLLAVVLSAVVGAHAQGTINFQNSSAQAIRHYQTATNTTPGLVLVGLYYGVAGTSTEGGLAWIATTNTTLSAGRFFGGTVTTPATTAPGAAAVFQVR